MTNEEKSIRGGKESAGMLLKGNHPEKDGILAGLLAEEDFAARGARLGEHVAALDEHAGRLE